MPTAGLPRAQAQISDQRGYPTREWYAFFSRLLDESTDAGLSTQIQSILDRLKQLESGSIADLSIIGENSVSVVGMTSSGRVTITLEGDSETPAATWYYGTGPDGARGWYQLSDGFDVTSDLTKTVDPTTNVTTFDLADLSNTGVGAALLKITRDDKGRVSGTADATTDDLDEGTGNLYFTNERAAAAAPVHSVNGRTGEVVLNAADVGADASGAAATAVAAHVSETDPHPQYAPLLRPKFTDWIGVGASPDRPVTISTATNTLPTGSASFLIYGDNNKERLEMRGAAESDPTFQAKSAGGTSASPSATPNGRRLCQIGGSGHNGVDWVIQNKAIIRLYATEEWTPTANGAAIAVITTSNGDMLQTERWKWEHDGNYMPCLDNTYTLGSGSLRIKEVFAANGTINTSDAREKTHVRPLTNAELEASIEIGGRIGAYRWLNMVDTKGDAARQHIGLTVQEAIAVLESHGLDPFAYGFICYDEWTELPEIRNEWAALPQVVDDFGNVVQEARNAGFEVVQEYRPAGDRYSFRMDELLAFLVRGLAHRLDAVERRLSVAGL